MPPQARSRSAWVVLVMAVVATACGSDRSEPRPVALLASTPQAAAPFDAIREAWRESDRPPSPALRHRIQHFIPHLPNDELVGLAPLRLALLGLLCPGF